MSDFLKKLKQSLDTGVQNDAIKAGFDEIVSKSEQIESDREALKALGEKEKSAVEERKPLTESEIELLKLSSTPNEFGYLTSEDGRAEEQKMIKHEEMLMDQGKIKMLKDEVIAYKEALLKKELLLSKMMTNYQEVYGKDMYNKMVESFKLIYGENCD